MSCRVFDVNVRCRVSAGIVCMDTVSVEFGTVVTLALDSLAFAYASFLCTVSYIF
jgi:hypothetical protein